MNKIGVIAALRERIDKTPNTPARKFKRDDDWITITFSEFSDQIIHFALGLRELGINQGDRAGIISETRIEWEIIDLAILSIGAVTVGVYPTSTEKQVEYILAHSECRALILENEQQHSRLAENIRDLKKIEQVILIDGIAPNSHSFEMIIDAGIKIAADNPDLWPGLADSVDPDAMAALVYTSGTTGEPKGVVLTHRNFDYSCRAVLESRPEEGLIGLSLLPMAHILQRVGAYCSVYRDSLLAYAESIDRLSQNLIEVRPHVMAAVPRLFEKIHAAIMARLEGENERRRKIFGAAIEIGLRRSRLIQTGRPIPFSLALKYRFFDRLVFKKIRSRLGGNFKYIVSGGAPLAPALAEFFHACGLLIIEGYGLTETSAPCTINRIEDFRFGTVGKPLPGTEIKIADDGEILVKGDGVFQGYYKDEQATADAFTEDHFFRTGDTGLLDSKGFLKITDRKKDLIITAGGKNIAPAEMENMLKGEALISNIVVIGDNRPYLTALITIDEEEASGFLERRGANEKNRNEILIEALRELVDEANNKLARYQTIKRVAILLKDFSIETGELTPTLKVKRKVVNKNHADLIDRLYGGGDRFIIDGVESK